MIFGKLTKCTESIVNCGLHILIAIAIDNRLISLVALITHT